MANHNGHLGRTWRGGREPSWRGRLTTALVAALQQGDVRGFSAEVQRLMQAPTGASCAEVARALESVTPGLLPWPEVRVAVLASFTAAPLAPVVTGVAAASGVLVRTRVADGDQWAQEVLDPESGLRQFAPDVIVVALQLEDLSPVLAQEPLTLDEAALGKHASDVVTRVGDLLDAIRAWSPAKILLHAVAAPFERSLGILDATHQRGQTRALRQIDEAIRERASAARDVYLVEVNHLIAQVGHEGWLDPRMWLLARMPFTPAAMVALAEEYVRYLRAFTGRVRKVLVVDLDGTLWGGVIGEDGIEGIHLGVGYKGRAYTDVQHVLRNLSRRGVLLAVNSKNNLDDVLEVFDGHGGMLLRRDAFAAMRVNWQDKVANLVEMSDELGLGLDSFVFVDDSAAECERVRQALPEVLTVQLTGDPATYARQLRRLGVFDSLSFGDEDRTRTAMYRSEAQRRELRQSMTSLDDFLRSLDMELEVEPITADSMARAAELTQRTNQFNMTTRRFTVDALRTYLSKPDHDGFVFRLRDRFGDHGLIGLALIAHGDGRATIETLLLSCRVLKRSVEDAVLSVLVEHAREGGAAVVEGLFVPTRKNGVAAGFYEERGFSRGGQEGDVEQRFVRSASAALPFPSWITCRRPERRHV